MNTIARVPPLPAITRMPAISQQIWDRPFNCEVQQTG